MKSLFEAGDEVANGQVNRIRKRMLDLAATLPKAAAVEKQLKASAARKPKTAAQLLLEERRAAAERRAAKEEGLSVVDLKRAASSSRLRVSVDASEVPQRLIKKFGLGEDGRRRMDLYVRLEKIVKVHGQVAVDVISDCVADAVTKSKPSRYFCRSVLARLRDRRLLDGVQTGDPTW